MSSVPLIVPEQADIERLSETELAYHRQVMAEVAHLPAIDQQIAFLQARKLAIEGVRESWMRFQKDCRGLDNGDTIDGDGYVHRQVVGGMAVPDGEEQ